MDMGGWRDAGAAICVWGGEDRVSRVTDPCRTWGAVQQPYVAE